MALPPLFCGAFHLNNTLPLPAKPLFELATELIVGKPGTVATGVWVSLAE